MLLVILAGVLLYAWRDVRSRSLRNDWSRTLDVAFVFVLLTAMQGWFGEAGTAFGKNPPFLPEGAIFKRIVATPDEGQAPFDIEDLYAAYMLQEAADALGFGRGGRISRRQSRFIFYMVTVNLL